ncbi:zinc finger, C2H2-type domain containing protein [Rhodotorula toruloides]|uniref:Zinc finger, C2H2-type domain containing protein n=1 Tax=Rhodotorula toruloides TaxID=5286 RepID=A0A511K9D6_RHOTO|nr:zinc finger, C2H2-type domain containing protein [Rhodotorula toruloides]
MLARLAVTAFAGVLATSVIAQLQSMRATIPGTLHQFADAFQPSRAVRVNQSLLLRHLQHPALSVLFLPSLQVPNSLRSGTTNLSEAEKYNPVLALEGIETPDAQQYDFQLQVREGEVVELFGFLPDGSGKALSLTRTITTPLPGATNCLNNVPTSYVLALLILIGICSHRERILQRLGCGSCHDCRVGSSVVCVERSWIERVVALDDALFLGDRRRFRLVQLIVLRILLAILLANFDFDAIVRSRQGPAQSRRHSRPRLLAALRHPLAPSSDALPGSHAALYYYVGHTRTHTRPSRPPPRMHAVQDDPDRKPMLSSASSASFAFEIQPAQHMPPQQQSDGGLLTTEPLHSMPAQRVEAGGASSTSYEPWQPHGHSAGGAGRWYEGQGGQAHQQDGHTQQQAYAGYTPTQHLPTVVPYPTSQPSALAAYTGWQSHQQHTAYQPYHLPSIDAPNSQPNGAAYEPQQPVTLALPSYSTQSYSRTDSYASYTHPQPHSYSNSHSGTPSDTPPAHHPSNGAYRPPPFNLSLPSIAQSLPPAYGMGPYGQTSIDHTNPAMARYGPPHPTDANAIPGPSTALSLSHQRSITPLAPSAPHLNAADVGTAPTGFEDGFNGSRQGQQGSAGRKRKEPKDAATRKYQCTECEQKFARPSALATHINHALAPSQESSHAKRTDPASGQQQRRSADSSATHSNGLQSASPAVPHHLIDGHNPNHFGMSPPLQTATASLSLPPLPYT